MVYCIARYATSDAPPLTASQVHTTGMDIRQAIQARAAVTLGKDMTFRDYAQGAYRMRGLATGQQLTLLVIPEVAELIAAETAGAKPPWLPNQRRCRPAVWGLPSCAHLRRK